MILENNGELRELVRIKSQYSGLLARFTVLKTLHLLMKRSYSTPKEILSKSRN
jgi:hypothetical protein